MSDHLCIILPGYEFMSNIRASEETLHKLRRHIGEHNLPIQMVSQAVDRKGNPLPDCIAVYRAKDASNISLRAFWEIVMSDAQGGLHAEPFFSRTMAGKIYSRVTPQFDYEKHFLNQWGSVLKESPRLMLEHNDKQPDAVLGVNVVRANMEVNLLEPDTRTAKYQFIGVDPDDLLSKQLHIAETHFTVTDTETGITEQYNIRQLIPRVVNYGSDARQCKWRGVAHLELYHGLLTKEGAKTKIFKDLPITQSIIFAMAHDITIDRATAKMTSTCEVTLKNSNIDHPYAHRIQISDIGYKVSARHTL